MIRRRAALAAAAALPLAARAQTAERPLRLLCSWTPGGSIDLYLRGAAQILAPLLQRPIVVENRGGASGSVGTAWLRQQRADGGLIAGVTEAVFRIALVQSVDYNALEDFTYLAGTSTLVWGWAVKRESRIKDLADLVARAKARPEGISYAAGGTAANPPVGMKVLEHRTGCRFLFVPFAGGAEMVNAVMSGTVDVVFDSLGAVTGMVEGGAMRMLGVAAEQRFARWPEVPTAREQGFDVVHQLPTGFIAPRGLPPEVAAHLEAALLRMVDDPAHAVLLQRLNLAPWRRDAAAYAAHVRDLFNTMPALLREIGMLPAQGATTR